ncbi:crotonase/enoyl-CoA hydratase family protein [Roseiterribacter gracilis]|uniref:Enoyl-CoA hydratase n=1 Tax=Roseiterribacter gracilis TaxID=2812848 RepID=A0A8S8XD00_9PROT|nr:enoyl-CoA hydratase [Rhodospirillales bacterium TMPK1]
MTIRTDQDGALARLTIDRPHRLNALNYATIDALLAALDAIERDDTVRAIVLTGAGTQAFSAGADIHEFAGSIAAGPSVAVREFPRRGQRLTSRIEAFPKPVIVAVNGLAYGGGCEITEAAPLAIACEEATFSKAEIKLGLPPTFGGTQRLPRLIGRKRAMEAILTAAPFSAQRAMEMGLINRVVPRARLLDEANSLGLAIAAFAPRAVSACLAAVTRGLNVSIDEGLAIEAAEFAALVGSHDLAEGVAAFRERRAPRFTGV